MEAMISPRSLLRSLKGTDEFKRVPCDSIWLTPNDLNAIS